MLARSSKNISQYHLNLTVPSVAEHPASLGEKARNLSFPPSGKRVQARYIPTEIRDSEKCSPENPRLQDHFIKAGTKHPTFILQLKSVGANSVFFPVRHSKCSAGPIFSSEAKFSTSTGIRSCQAMVTLSTFPCKISRVPDCVQQRFLPFPQPVAVLQASTAEI